MKKYNIPTAAYENFDTPEAALAYLETADFPIVLKADGLALGKGVLICENKADALAGVDELMLDKKFGTAGDTIVIEERIIVQPEIEIVFLHGCSPCPRSIHTSIPEDTILDLDSHLRIQLTNRLNGSIC